jgi:RNA ligase (TIGR02306 family)
MHGLVYTGKIISIENIPNADFIACATVVCGEGGKWKGIVKKADFHTGDMCIVYLPDALIPIDTKGMEFMASSGWRVRMRRFRGAPSEVVIMPDTIGLPIGTDITSQMGVIKYHKPISAKLQGLAKGDFPSFIPKTDEPNYQRHGELVAALVGKPYYITEKADGSSTTAFRWKGEFGLCSRNLELQRNEDNGYWKVALKYGLEEKLPEGYALQWETCGPGVQSNPMGLPDLDGFAFSAYKIDEHRYLDVDDFIDLCDKTLGFPRCRFLAWGSAFDDAGIEKLGEGTYENGKQREGVVVRSANNVGHAPISFKVINLDYDK